MHEGDDHPGIEEHGFTACGGDFYARAHPRHRSCRDSGVQINPLCAVGTSKR
jgi:hypothetical protein